MQPLSIRRSRPLVLTAVLVLGALCSARAGAFEFFDRRLQIHGFYEAQLRGINQDLEDEWDLTQLAHVLNVEIEADVAPDGWGPFDFVGAFARLEARYDCIWSRACGLFPSADVYGDRVNKLPKRLMNGRRSGFTQNATSGDIRRYRGESPATDFAFRGIGTGTGSRRAYPIDETVAFFSLFLSPGPDGIPETGDETGDFVFSRYSDCRFSTRRLGGPAPEVALSIQNLGPLDPDCFVEPIAAATDKPNPFRGPVDFYGNVRPDGGDLNPITGAFGTGDLPLRPAPLLPAGSNVRGEANGLWYPNPEMRRLLGRDVIEHFNGNFRESELMWNHGASQQDERELKEAYLDLEMFDSRLWMRLGKQQIVWGKTELFRNQDQFNPQDFALSSLPNLEESRIGLWAFRGVWSFYDVGPFQDVRAELAMNFDQFEFADLGRCGEPYSVVLVCAGYFGFLAHGITQIGLAGVRTPPNAWEDLSGVEFGGRIEWRWKRFSFALSNFYGFQDLPYVERIFHYRRNVDPVSGAPRRAGASGDCATPAFERNPGFVFADGNSPTNRFFRPVASPDPGCLTAANALTEHPANLTVFAHSCATIIGLIEQAPQECGNQLFNSANSFLTSMPVGNTELAPILAALLSNQFVGNPVAWSVLQSAAGALPPPNAFPFVTLNTDPCDSFLADCATPGPTTHTFFSVSPFSVNTTLTAQQQALLGCGQFYGTDCERDGIDLFSAEASVLSQSLSGFEGTFGDWDTFDGSVPQPGTVGFVGGPVATRPIAGELAMLPGSRGPNDPDNALDDDGVAFQLATGVTGFLYDPRVDGCTGPLTAAATPTAVADCAGSSVLLHPTAGWVGPGPDGFVTFGGDDLYDGDGDGIFNEPEDRQRFASEMAALSYNYGVVLAGLSLPPSNAILPITEIDAPPEIDEFDVGAGPDLVRGGANAADDDLGPDGILNTLDDPIFREDGCSLRRPQLCKNFEAFVRSLRVQRNDVRAGGTGRFGRRDFQWHEGAPAVVRFEKANVLGFSTDFTEDWSKSNWSLELTWVEDVPFFDNNEVDGLSDADTYNLTVSVDRPTFVNFLNANRTFFVNSQWFFQYVDGFNRGFTSNGPWNVLATLTVTTGYFQDRLLPTITLVYDKRSNSGAFLPSVSYRFTENFSATVGLALFAGSVQQKTMALVPFASGNRVGGGAYHDYAENGLSAVRERDEAFLRIKYTF